MLAFKNLALDIVRTKSIVTVRGNIVVEAGMWTDLRSDILKISKLT